MPIKNGQIITKFHYMYMVQMENVENMILQQGMIY